MMAMALGAGALNADKSMQPIASDPVETSSGRVAGTALASGVKAYLGVPFAAPPPATCAGPRPARPLDRHSTPTAKARPAFSAAPA
jgi:para-nitrobenzyl esterase